jgi:dodecin
VSDHVYGLSDIVGSSTTGVDDAVRAAIRKASQTIRHIEWFEAAEIRGHVQDGDIAHFQVKLRIGFRIEN